MEDIWKTRSGCTIAEVLCWDADHRELTCILTKNGKTWCAKIDPQLLAKNTPLQDVINDAMVKIEDDELTYKASA